MLTALFILACMAGFMVRDGWPSWRKFLDKVWPTHPSFLNPTELARVSGAIICGLGALAVFPLAHAAIFAGLVLLSFFTDQKHGEGQGPDKSPAETAHNVPFLALSGASSMLPLSIAADYVHGLHDLMPGALVLLAGLSKVIIWPVCWQVISFFKLTRYLTIDPAVNESFFSPTRLAAMLFGALTAATAVLWVFHG